MSEVRQQRDIQLAQPSLLPGSVHPGEVSEVGVHGARDNLQWLKLIVITIIRLNVVWW